MITVPPAYEQFRGVDPDTIDALVDGLKDVTRTAVQPNVVTAQQVAEGLSTRYPRESVDRLVNFFKKENGPNQMSVGSSMILWFMDLAAWLRQQNPI